MHFGFQDWNQHTGAKELVDDGRHPKQLSRGLRTGGDSDRQPLGRLSARAWPLLYLLSPVVRANQSFLSSRLSYRLAIAGASQLSR